MKKLMLFILCVSAFTVISCDNSNDTLTEKSISPRLEDVSTVLITPSGKIIPKTTRSINGTEVALRFKDTTSLQKFEEMLSSISDNIKVEIIKKYGIENLYDIAERADRELDTIGQKANSENEFRALYSKYKQKYIAQLINNKNDTLDLSLYVPDENNMESYIGNTKGFYVVGNNVQHVMLSPTLTTAYSGNVIPINSYSYEPQKHKKIYFSAYIKGNHLWINMHAKKKMWYGWKNDPNRSFYFDSYLSSNFVYLQEGKYGQEIIATRLPRYIFENNVSNGFNIILGKISSGSQISGYFNTWTDLTSEHLPNGKDATEIIEGKIVPKCLLSKTQKVSISLKLQN